MADDLTVALVDQYDFQYFGWIRALAFIFLWYIVSTICT